MQQDEKIQKLLAQAGIASRRQIERWIALGRIKVNGQLATIGQRISASDKVFVDNQPVALVHIDTVATEVLLYNKPEGEICTRKDEAGRPTVFTNLPKQQQGKWLSIGRLDFNSQGLLLFTNNGELANRLMHPKYQLEREYAVRVLGEVSDEMLSNLLNGVMLDGYDGKFKEIIDKGGKGANHWYNVILTEGRNREVRKLWETQGVTVSRLIRIRYGDIILPRDLPLGQCRYLNRSKVRKLMAQFSNSRRDVE